MIKEIEYKGYYITSGFYANGSVTVDFCGDEIYFNTMEEAKEFIDEQEEA